MSLALHTFFSTQPAVLKIENSTPTVLLSLMIMYCMVAEVLRYYTSTNYIGCVLSLTLCLVLAVTVTVCVFKIHKKPRPKKGIDNIELYMIPCLIYYLMHSENCTRTAKCAAVTYPMLSGTNLSTS